MNPFFRHTKLMLAAVPLFVATLLSGCGSGCGSLGVANTSTCGNATSSANTTATASTYSISGTVSAGAAANATITLTGAGTGSTSAANGAYSFTALPNGSYNVVPSLAGTAFTPVSTAVTISGQDVTAISFTATANAAATYSISGAVSGPVKQNVLITLTLGGSTSGTTIGTAVTEPDGSYSFSGLVAGTYTVAPSLSGYIFTPASNAVPLSSSLPTANVSFTEALAN